MERNHLTNLEGAKEKTRESPMSDNIREYTDGLYIYLFILILSTWLGLIGYVFIDGLGMQFLTQSYDDFSSTEAQLKSVAPKFEINLNILSCFARGPFHRGDLRENSTLFIVIGVVLAVVFLFSYLILIRYHSRLGIWIGNIFVLLLIVKMIFEIYSKFTATFDLLFYPLYVITNFKMRNDIINITRIIFSVVGLICFSKIKVHDVSEILENALKTFFFFSYLILFGLIFLTLELAVLFISFVALYSYSKSITTIYFTLFEGWYLCAFIFYYAKMTISPTLATWFWTRDKKDIPKTLVFKNMIEVTRHHFGTICLSAVPILPIVIAVLAAYKSKLNKNRKTFNRISDVLLFIYLIWNSIDYSLIIVSMYGRDFYKSTKETFQILTKNSPLSFAFIYIFDAILVVGTFIIIFLAILPSIIWHYFDPIPVLFYILPVMLPIIILFQISGQVQLICSLVDNKEYNEADDNENMRRL